ncbi:MAG TPA: protein kinase [Thermoanaerobaculia bacterium]
MHAIEPGTRLGRYEVRAPLGAGGMGEVLLAHDTDLDRPVALKILSGFEGDQRARVLRFMQEARAASALSHPNVAHVYEVGSSDALHFIAMELVAGETLRERVARGPLPLEQAIDIATQVASALGAAHAKGIVHRDIKPENVMIRPDGYVKVLDFGLAKLREMTTEGATAVRTDSGVVVGTLAYMAPEQLQGASVDARADLFALGVVLHEMLAGSRPFQGSTHNELVAAILSRDPRPLSELRPELPTAISALVAKLLEKSPQRRCASAEEVVAALREIREEAAVATRISSGAVRIAPGRRKAIAVAAAVLAGIALAGWGGWRMVERQRDRAAEASLARAAALLERDEYVGAWQAASAAAARFPGDARVAEILSATTVKLRVASDPPGARVFLARFGDPAPRTLLGVTPVETSIPRADFVATIEKEGFSPLVRPVTASPVRVDQTFNLAPPEIRLDAKLFRVGDVPAGMVPVNGGEYRLRGWYRPTDRLATLSDFFIDRREVTNAEFEEFIRDGGYRRRELWKHPFVKDGRTLAFEEAMAMMRDATGLAAPRGWSSGRPPAGRDDYPVTGITWYEAAAYAEWKGKKLPTVYQWERAARPVVAAVRGIVMPWGLVAEGIDLGERANFSGKDLLPAGSMPFGVSPWGALNMAGNAAEWCRNPKDSGFAVRGGAFDDPSYNFGYTGAYPPFYSSASIGFRCVLERSPASDQGGFDLGQGTFVPSYQPVDDAAFARLRRAYDYPRAPLNAKVVRIEEEKRWTRETITFTGANGKTAILYLYLPKGFPRPLQVLHYAPAGDVAAGVRPLRESMRRIEPFVLSGRAVFSVAVEGYLDRPYPPGLALPDTQSVEYVDFIAERIIDLRRGLDYVTSRPEIDKSRVGFFAISAGSWSGVILGAVEERYRSIMFIGTGIRALEKDDAEAANRIHFAPRILQPKLMLQGKWDEAIAFDSEAMPLYNLLREPKRLEVYEGGHVPPPARMISSTTAWFDETLGPVAQ